MNCVKRDGCGLVRTDEERVPLAATMLSRWVDGLFLLCSSALVDPRSLPLLGRAGVVLPNVANGAKYAKGEQWGCHNGPSTVG